MNNEDVVERIVAVEQRSKSNTRRIDNLEKNTEALQELVSVVKEMNIKQDYTIQKVDKIDKRVDTIEEKPAKKWEGVTEKVLYAVISLIVGFVFAKIGIA